MRRIVVLVAVLAVLGSAVLYYRLHRAALRERDHLARIQALIKRRATQAVVEAELGPPTEKLKSGDCTQEWTYKISLLRSAFLCFDETRRVVSLRTGVVISRRDFSHLKGSAGPD
jgi:hypothetical protein